MMGLFQDPEVSWHDGSHFVPAGVEQRKVFTQFIERVGMVGKKDDSKL